jgi:hypothetical protein
MSIPDLRKFKTLPKKEDVAHAPVSAAQHEPVTTNMPTDKHSSSPAVAAGICAIHPKPMDPPPGPIADQSSAEVAKIRKTSERPWNEYVGRPVLSRHADSKSGNTSKIRKGSSSSKISKPSKPRKPSKSDKTSKSRKHDISPYPIVSLNRLLQPRRSNNQRQRVLDELKKTKSKFIVEGDSMPLALPT